MSLQAIVLSLIDGINDPAVRSDIASTIYFLRDLYLSGRINPEELKAELVNVVSTVIDVTQPDLLPEEKEKKVNMLVDQLYKAIRLETMKGRLTTRYRMSPME